MHSVYSLYSLYVMLINNGVSTCARDSHNKSKSSHPRTSINNQSIKPNLRPLLLPPNPRILIKRPICLMSLLLNRRPKP